MILTVYQIFNGPTQFQGKYKIEEDETENFVLTVYFQTGRRTSTSFEAISALSATGISNLVR
jgi:aspartate carbamoyltransferase catalytic subunit